VDILVSREGRPVQVLAFDGPEAFVEAAVTAVEGYRFYPAEDADGEPIEVAGVQNKFTYELEN